MFTYRSILMSYVCTYYLDKDHCLCIGPWLRLRNLSTKVKTETALIFNVAQMKELHIHYYLPYTTMSVTYTHRKEAHLGLEPLGFLAHSLANSYQVSTNLLLLTTPYVWPYVVYATQVTIKKYVQLCCPSPRIRFTAGKWLHVILWFLLMVSSA